MSGPREDDRDTERADLAEVREDDRTGPEAPDRPEDQSVPSEDARREAERRRRRARIFGEVLPEATSDERAGAWGDRDAGAESSDEWLRRQVPPHHG